MFYNDVGILICRESNKVHIVALFKFIVLTNQILHRSIFSFSLNRCILPDILVFSICFYTSFTIHSHIHQLHGENFTTVKVYRPKNYHTLMK